MTHRGTILKRFVGSAPSAPARGAGLYEDRRKWSSDRTILPVAWTASGPSALIPEPATGETAACPRRGAASPKSRPNHQPSDYESVRGPSASFVQDHCGCSRPGRLNQCRPIPPRTSGWVAHKVATPCFVTAMRQSVRPLDHPIAIGRSSAPTGSRQAHPGGCAPPRSRTGRHAAPGAWGGGRR
jgi:hypothetical protein